MQCKDHEEPELADYDRGVAFIQKWNSKGGKVLVHCKAGHGRWECDERELISTGDNKTGTSLDYTKSRRPRRWFLRENENPVRFTCLQFCTKPELLSGVY